jgi:predicted amidophosphoribosyltransferase
VSERSRLLCALLKAADNHFIFKYAVRVRQQVAGASPLAGFLGPDLLLVPVPPSAPQPAGAVWVADRLAMALVCEGLGGTVWRGLHRIRAVRKSATAAPGARPTVDAHFHSFGIDRAAMVYRRIVLIDDVVTKGRTLLAAASRVQQTFPDAQIRAFALLRTMGFVREVSRLLEPCVGEIRWRAGDAFRNP